MKLSSLFEDSLSSLSAEKIENIVFGGEVFSDPSADVALLLGCPPESSRERAEAAARLYFEGKVPFIVPSGGVEWEYSGKKQSEAEFMTDILIANGVPREAIIIENEARTTKENMIYGTLQINRNLNFYNVKKVCIVTSAFHLRRSVELARVFLPRTAEIVGYPATPIVEARKNWRTDEKKESAVVREIPLLKSLVAHKMIDDIEF